MQPISPQRRRDIIDALRKGTVPRAGLALFAVGLERFELPCPVDDASAHRCPIVVLTFFHRVFAVTVADAVFGQMTVAIGIWNFAALSCVAWVPHQHEVRRIHSSQHIRGFGRCSGVASVFVLEEQSNAILPCLLSSAPQHFIHRISIRCRIIKPPEIETSHELRTQRFCQCNTAL